jgi:hypothetical protein
MYKCYFVVHFTIIQTIFILSKTLDIMITSHMSAFSTEFKDSTILWLKPSHLEAYLYT